MNPARLNVPTSETTRSCFVFSEKYEVGVRPRYGIGVQYAKNWTKRAEMGYEGIIASTVRFSVEK